MYQLCLNMIVKDESHVIRETLESVVKYVDYYVISDTGSTDDTVNIIKEFFDDMGVPGEVYHDKWSDFGHNRSLALEHARGKSEYIWVIDADDLIIGDMEMNNLVYDYYQIKIGKEFGYTRTNVFKNFKEYPWRYIGKIHEYPTCDKPDMTSGVIGGSYYLKSRRLGNRNRDPDKYLKDALILENELKSDPTNARNTFYCARSYFDHGDYGKAIEFFGRRIQMGGYQEEVYYSLYQMAISKRSLGDDWDSVEKTFMMAHNHSKHRLEPIYEIAKRYRLNGDFDKAYSFASRGVKIAVPIDDLLFVSYDVYEWKIIEEFALSAYYTGRFKESLKAYRKLVNMDLDDNTISRLQDSYNFAFKKVNETKGSCLVYFGNMIISRESTVWNIVNDLIQFYNVDVMGNCIDDVPDGVGYQYDVSETYDLVVGYDSINFLHSAIKSKHKVLYLRDPIIKYLFDGPVEMYIHDVATVNSYLGKIDLIVCDTDKTNMLFRNDYIIDNSYGLRTYGDLDDFDISNCKVGQLTKSSITVNRFSYPNKIRQNPNYLNALLLSMENEGVFQAEVLLEIGKIKLSIGNYESAERYLTDAINCTDNDALIDEISDELRKIKHSSIGNLESLMTVIKKIDLTYIDRNC